MDINQRFFPEIGAGGFTRRDGTLQFYLRVNALLEEDMTVVDLGAGRGSIAEDGNRAIRQLATLKGKVRRVIGVDIDPVVKTNPILDEAIVYDGERLPLSDSSIDLIVCDHTFEHVEKPDAFAAEIARVVKPGGWICARTPHLYSLPALAGALVPNRLHARLLRRAQTDRKAKDVFPTFYRLNSIRRLTSHFPTTVWRNFSYTWSPEPAYHFNRPLIYALFLAYQYLKQPFFGGEVLLVFLRKEKSRNESVSA